MNRSRKDVTLMFVMGTLLLFAVFNFVFKPQRSSLSAARGDLQRIEQNLSAADAQLRAPVVTSPGRTQDASSTAVPADPAVSTLLRQLQAVADSSGVVLASVAPTSLSANPMGPGGSLQVSISASGSHGAVQAYVVALRDLDRLAVVEQIGISTQAATPLTAQTDQVALSVRVFTLQSPPSVALPIHPDGHTDLRAVTAGCSARPIVEKWGDLVRWSHQPADTSIVKRTYRRYIQ